MIFFKKVSRLRGVGLERQNFFTLFIYIFFYFWFNEEKSDKIYKITLLKYESNHGHCVGKNKRKMTLLRIRF